MRLRVAALAGIVIGLAVDILSNAALYVPFDVNWPPNLTGFWGLVYGSFAAVVSFGIAFWLLHPRVSRHRRGGYIVAFALALFGLAVVGFILMWGVSPFSLEGAWIYPVAVIPLIGAATVLGTLRSRTSETEPRGRGSGAIHR